VIRLALAAIAMIGAPAAAATRTYSVTSFDKVRIEGPYAVTLRVGPGGSAVANGDVRAIDRLSVEVSNRVLIVRTSKSGWGGWSGDNPGTLALSLTSPNIVAASVAGSGSIAIDRAKAQRFDLVVSGAGSADIAAVEADRLIASLIGAGTIRVAGKASQVRATVQGSGSIDAMKLAADDLELTVAGPGGAQFAARRTAKVTTSGSGDVIVTGDAACTVASAGSGQVRCGKGAAAD
jgi:hypothetical protein